MQLGGESGGQVTNMLFQMRNSTRVRREFVTQRVMNDWNRLDIEAETFNMLKYRVDQKWPVIWVAHIGGKQAIV